MPTESKKKKAKKDEKKPLILIKTEPEELKPLEHYADDRVVLIKQIFSSLKSKTIESIIPEFLQVKWNAIFKKPKNSFKKQTKLKFVQIYP